MKSSGDEAQQSVFYQAIRVILMHALFVCMFENPSKLHKVWLLVQILERKKSDWLS